MRASLTLAVAFITGCVAGAAALKGVQAQAKPPAFTIAEVDVIDPEAFQAFAKRNSVAVAAAGGHFLATVRGRVVGMRGTPPKAVNLIAWDNLDQAIAYFNSPPFKELIPLRDKGANVRLFQVEGVPK